MMMMMMMLMMVMSQDHRESFLQCWLMIDDVDLLIMMNYDMIIIVKMMKKMKMKMQMKMKMNEVMMA